MDLKEFEKFLKICRKYGVSDIKFDKIEAKLVEKHEMRSISDSADIETEELSPEQMIFYAVTNPAQ